MALEAYRKKRKFEVTSEPRGHKGRRGGHRYVIQKHAARRLHYDLRLELDGVMKSWAVTRGPSLDPGEKRLAVHVEDHPIEYNSFEGTIPRGEYGGGTVMIWDRGRWIPEGDPHKAYAKGHLTFELDGEKLHGRWHLVRLRARGKNDRHDNWLLIKAKDAASRSGRDNDILEQEPLSVTTGRSIEEIAAGKGKKRVWHSNRPADAVSGPQARRGLNAELKSLADSRAKPTESKAAKGAAAHAETQVETAAKLAARQGGASARATVGKRALLPDFVPPALAMLQAAAPSGAHWLHEIKLDGYRIEARLDHGEVQLLTRNRQDWSARFKPIADAVAALAADSALLDGELVVEDEQGISNFSLLQTDLKDGRSDRFIYRVFDLLHLNGRNAMEAPLVARKAALARLLHAESQTSRIRYVEHFDEAGPVVFKHACEMNLEGVISKRREAPYRSGRSDNFVKSKCHKAEEFVVAGFTPSTAAANAVGALIVAFRDNGALRYAGRVGTGYTDKTARDLWKRLERLRTSRPPLTVPQDERRKDVIWVTPQMVIEAEFRGITHDGLLRQASYKGVREDKAASDVVLETPVGAPAAMAQRRPKSTKTKTEPGLPKAAKRGASPAKAVLAKRSGDSVNISLTHPDRVYWGDVGLTKEDLAGYYLSVWDWMAPHVVGRPLALLRCPDGTEGECFFQKHIGANVKESPLRHVVDAKERDVIAIEKLDDLIAVVQSGALEIHTRGSRLERLAICDRVVFDFDPGEGVDWKEIVAAARETRDRLKDEALESFVKLSGGKGVHVVVPIDGVDWDIAKNFAQRVALSMAADSPQRYVGKMTKSLRAGKIFVDYFRNSREATSVCAYSTRARPGAPVSAPVSWEQLGRVTGSNEFTVLNLKRHFRKDPWADLGKLRQKLPAR
ncbi:MAG TPA: DNA ligase D [Xanthobacteraceae bacterium]|jgi:bifunctional non-homologous end joining protein LigD